MLNKLGQLGLILGVLFIGEFLNLKYNLPVPSTILAMLILLFLMVIKVVKLKWVERMGNILLDNLSLLFIPAGVAISNELGLFKGIIIKLSLIIFFSTVLTILVTGYTIEYLEKRKRGKSI